MKNPSKIDLGGLLGAVLGALGGVLGRLGGVLGPLGSLLVSCGVLQVFLGASWGRLGPSWGRLGGVLEASWLPRWPHVGGQDGAKIALGRLGSVLGAS